MLMYIFGKKIWKKCLQKRKLRNIHSSFLLCMDFIFIEIWVHPLANKNLGDSSELASVLIPKEQFNLLT